MNFRKILPDLRTDESIYVFARPHFLAFLPWMLIGGFLIVVAITVLLITIFNFGDILGGGLGYNIVVILGSAFFLLMLAFLTVAFIDYYYDLHIVTDRRIVDIDQRSLFVREINELALEEVQDVTYKMQGVLPSLFDYGMVEVETAGSALKFEFDNIKHPQAVTSIILDLADQCKMRISDKEGVVGAPRQPVKAVIESKVYTSIEPLLEMGAVMPADLQDREGTDPTLPEGGAVRTAKNVEVVGIPTKQAAEEKSFHKLPERVEVVGAQSDNQPKKDSPGQRVSKPEPTPQPQEFEGEEDLDIIIDPPDPSGRKGNK